MVLASRSHGGDGGDDGGCRSSSKNGRHEGM